jgi:Protein of unknown function (DUF2877)
VTAFSERRDALPVAAPPRVAAWIRAAPDGPVRVLHGGRDMIHLDVGGRAVGVASAGAPGLPHALRTDLTTMSALLSSLTAQTPYLEFGSLHLGGRVLVAGRFVDVRAPRLDAARTPKTSPVSESGTPRSRGAGLVAADDRTGLPREVDAAAVAGLVGGGDGLTPLGDDVLCGWLAAHRAAGVPTPGVDDAVRRALRRTTTVSATLLECALAGECADLVAAYLRALGTPLERVARTALETLGHSSGAGLAYGVDLALAQLAREAAA